MITKIVMCQSPCKFDNKRIMMTGGCGGAVEIFCTGVGCSEAGKHREREREGDT